MDAINISFYLLHYIICLATLRWILLRYDLWLRERKISMTTWAAHVWTNWNDYQWWVISFVRKYSQIEQKNIFINLSCNLHWIVYDILKIYRYSVFREYQKSIYKYDKACSNFKWHPRKYKSSESQTVFKKGIHDKPLNRIR